MDAGGIYGSGGFMYRSYSQACMHLSFSCSLRIGEILGLRWENVHISKSDYEQQMLCLDIECELQRVNREVIEKVGTRKT